MRPSFRAFHRLLRPCNGSRALQLVAMAMAMAVVLPGGQARPAPGIPARTWQAKCSKTSCDVQILVPFERGHGLEQAGLAVDFVPKTKRANSIAIFLPADAVAAKGVIIGLVDRGGGDQRLKPVDDLYTLPITQCTPEFCVSRVQQMLDNDDGTFFDLLAALQRNRFLWVSFWRPHQNDPVRILIPSSALKAELAKLVQVHGSH